MFKVDTHIHHSAAMSAKHLLKFIKSKYETAGDEHVAISKDRKKITLRELFEEMNVNPLELSINSLDVQADKNIF